MLLFRKVRCNTANAIGYSLHSHARQREAIPYYQAAILGYQALIGEFPADPEYRFVLARTLNNYGIVSLELGDSVRAIDAFRQSCDLQRQKPTL